MEAGRWFEDNQHMLLWMANKTKDGRKLLRLDQTGFDRIDGIGHNRVWADKYVRDGGTLFRPLYRRVTTTDFRVGCKWANLINSQWDWFCELREEYLTRLAFPKWFPAQERIIGLVGAHLTTSTFYPDPDPETTTFDGEILRDSVSELWATIRVGAGNLVQDTLTNGSGCIITSDSVTDKWFRLGRGFFLFDTSSIPDTDTIDSVTLSLYGSQKTDEATAITPNLNIYQATTASNTGGTNSDFANIGSTSFSTAITYANWTTAAYNDFNLNSNGLNNISKTGVSKFGTRNQQYDADAATPTWSSGFPSHFLKSWHAEDTGTSRDPKLVVTHSSAATGQLLFQMLKVA